MRRYSRKLVDDAVSQLDRFGESAVALRVIAEWIVTRTNRTAATRVAEPDSFVRELRTRQVDDCDVQAFRHRLERRSCP